jgi:hypothetical protein
MELRISSCALSLLLLMLSLQHPPLHASDTLVANQQFTGNQSLISQNGNFALGFFQPQGKPFLNHVSCCKLSAIKYGRTCYFYDYEYNVIFLRGKIFP